MDLEHNQILQKLVTGQEAQVSRVTTAFPDALTATFKRSSALGDTVGTGSLLPNPRMPVG